MPNHFLTGTANPNLLICPVEKPGETVNKRKWKAVQVELESFWQRRIREYLPIITTRKKWNIPTRNFVVGDLVLIADKNIPRSNWLLARITEIHRSIVKRKKHSLAIPARLLFMLLQRFLVSPSRLRIHNTLT